MDIVITYVNGLDPEWQESYASTVGMDTFRSKRYRDWGTLKYLLRGIEKNMPFIRNVFLLVSSQSQVPDWADTSSLKIVLHKDIIPEDHLPLFNSASIEMFLHRIPGLDEEFIYFNDDCFPVAPVSREDFYIDGKPAVWLHKHIYSGSNLYRNHVRRSSDLARDAAGLKKSHVFVRPQHAPLPMLKSSSEKLYAMKESDILSNVSALRQKKNYCQYIFTDYNYFTGRTVSRKLSNKHCAIAFSSIDRVIRAILHPEKKFICINDSDMPQNKYLICREKLLTAFEKNFPDTSRFEKAGSF